MFLCNLRVFKALLLMYHAWLLNPTGSIPVINALLEMSHFQDCILQLEWQLQMPPTCEGIHSS